MTEWPRRPLDELLDLHDSRRVPLSSAERSGRSGPYPYYGAQGVIDHIDDYIFDGRYILIPEDGENLRSRKLPIAYFAEGKFWVNNHAHIVTAKDGVAIDRFVQSAIEATDISPYITGAAQPKLSQRNLREVEIPAPGLEDQRGVAAVLDALDDLIEYNRRRVEVLEEMARAVYREWFVHFRFPGHEDATFVDSDLGPIPEGWDVVPLGSIATADRTTVHPKDEPETWFAHCSIPAFDDGQLPASEIGESIRSGKYAVTEPAVMVSKLNPRIPRTWFIEPTGPSPCVASTEFVILRPEGPRSLEWVYGTVTSPSFQDRLTQLSGGTSGSHQRLRPAEMLAIEVVDPPQELIGRLTGLLRPSLAIARRLRDNSERLAAIRDLLLPKLVTGKVDVSNLDLDAVVSRAAV